MVASQKLLGYANEQEAMLAELIEVVETLPDNSMQRIVVEAAIADLQRSVADFLEFAANLRKEGL